MKINKEQLKALADMPDSQLWDTIRGIAAKHGYTLPEAQPSGKDMEKIRGAMRGTEKINVGEAMKIVNNYKKR